MQFTKLEALGNDFLLIDERNAAGIADPSALAVAMCNRTRGAGADGLLLLADCDSARAEVAMRIFNADGSEAEVSGNGTRCVAAALDAEGRWLAEAPNVRVATAAGVKTLSRADGGSFRMDMGRPSFRAADVPFTGVQADAVAIDAALEAGGTIWTVTVSSIGNPHCTLFVDDPNAIDWRTSGASIERHPSFPNRTNVEFVRVASRDRIEPLFWERGVGETQSSGTGAVAAAAAAIVTGRCDRRLVVAMAGGAVTVEWPDDDSTAALTGPARVVYRGAWMAGMGQ